MTSISGVSILIECLCSNSSDEIANYVRFAKAGNISAKWERCRIKCRFEDDAAISSSQLLPPTMEPIEWHKLWFALRTAPPTSSHSPPTKRTLRRKLRRHKVPRVRHKTSATAHLRSPLKLLRAPIWRTYSANFPFIRNPSPLLRVVHLGRILSSLINLRNYWKPRSRSNNPLIENHLLDTSTKAALLRG